MKVIVGNKTFSVKVVDTESEARVGLQGVTSLPADEGMLFDFTSSVNTPAMWMRNTLIPLDIIFINDDLEVILVIEGTPNEEVLYAVPNTAYVLEVNIKSGVAKGDKVELEQPPVMKVLNTDGSTQVELWGGERIFSRKNTRVLVRKAKKAAESKLDTDYKSLGNFMFKCINIQNNNKPEYVESNT